MVSRTRSTSTAPNALRNSPDSDDSSTAQDDAHTEESQEILQSAQLPESVRDSIEPSDEDIATPEETTTPEVVIEVPTSVDPIAKPLREDVGEDLDIDTLKAKINEAKRRLLQKELESLHEAEDNFQPSMVTASTKPTSSSDRHEHEPKEPTISLPKIDLYHGHSMKEHREFVKQCRRHHAISPNTFKSELKKVNIAATLLRGTVSDSWEREVVRNPNGHTWESFTRWLLDQIDDPEKRRRDSYTQLKKARQRGGQTARQLLHEIEMYEDDLPEYTEDQKISNWWTALGDDLQRALNATGREFKTRDEYVKCASTLESGNPNLIPRRDGPTPGRYRNDRFDGPPRRSSNFGNNDNRARDAPSRPRRADGGTPAAGVNLEPTNRRPDGCWTCGEAGHLKRDCNKRRAINNVSFYRRDDSKNDEAFL